MFIDPYLTLIYPLKPQQDLYKTSTWPHHDLFMTSTWPLQDLYRISTGSLHDLYLTSIWPLYDLYMTSAWPLHDLYSLITSAWPLQSTWPLHDLYMTSTVYMTSLITSYLIFQVQQPLPQKPNTLYLLEGKDDGQARSHIPKYQSTIWWSIWTKDVYFL